MGGMLNIKTVYPLTVTHLSTTSHIGVARKFYWGLKNSALYRNETPKASRGI